MALLTFRMDDRDAAKFLAEFTDWIGLADNEEGPWFDVELARVEYPQHLGG